MKELPETICDVCEDNLGHLPTPDDYLQATHAHVMEKHSGREKDDPQCYVVLDDDGEMVDCLCGELPTSEKVPA